MAFEEYIEPLVSGDYTVRLVKNRQEREEYKLLRYRHLLQEFNPNHTDPAGTDTNGGYDEHTSQLCVFYKDRETMKESIVGGYVMMRFKSPDDYCKTSAEYDLTKLKAKHLYEIAEVSRAVVHPAHRQGKVIMMLIQGINRYVHTYNLRYVIGTTSFPWGQPTDYSHAFSYLYHYYLMPDDIMVTSTDKENGRMCFMEKSAVNKHLAIKQMPPLLHGYLAQNAEIGNGLFVDHEFKSIDVFTIADFTQFKRVKMR